MQELAFQQDTAVKIYISVFVTGIFTHFTAWQLVACDLLAIVKEKKTSEHLDKRRLLLKLRSRNRCLRHRNCCLPHRSPHHQYSTSQAAFWSRRLLQVHSIDSQAGWMPSWRAQEAHLSKSRLESAVFVECLECLQPQPQAQRLRRKCLLLSQGKEVATSSLQTLVSSLLMRL